MSIELLDGLGVQAAVDGEDLLRRRAGRRSRSRICVIAGPARRSWTARCTRPCCSCRPAQRVDVGVDEVLGQVRVGSRAIPGSTLAPVWRKVPIASPQSTRMLRPPSFWALRASAAWAGAAMIWPARRAAMRAPVPPTWTYSTWLTSTSENFRHWSATVAPRSPGLLMPTVPPTSWLASVTSGTLIEQVVDGLDVGHDRAQRDALLVGVDAEVQRVDDDVLLAGDDRAGGRVGVDDAAELDCDAATRSMYLDGLGQARPG